MKIFEWLWLGLVALSLAACGGGGGSGGSSLYGGSSSTTTAAPTLKLALSGTTVTAAAPVTATATLASALGEPLAGRVVSFSVPGGLGTLSAKTALTDASGTASVTVSPASSSSAGADTVVASISMETTDLSASSGFSLSATSVAITGFTTDVGASSSSRLSAYGQAVLTLSMSGVSTTNPVTVSFTSPCIVSGKAKVSSTSVNDTSGSVLLTYQDLGCGATATSDTVTASITGSTASRQVVIYPGQPSANSVAFVSASPTTIYLAGSGLTQSSTVKFQVNDTSGNPLPNQTVTLSLTTYTGGLLLDGSTGGTTTKTTDSAGQVSTIVTAGTVPTPVRVTAALASGVSTVSSNLAVAVGLPHQIGFSLSQTTKNIEGGSIDGTTNSYTILAADRSGNPVPAGTAISFWAEGGQIVGSQATVLTNAGLATATAAFLSQEPRPNDGRVTVTAYAIGEESFKDLNGNNAWDSGEPFQDLGDVVKDMRHDGSYESGNDEYVSLAGTSSAGSLSCVDVSATYPTLAVGTDIPSRAGTCDGTWTRRTYVRRSVETVLSTSAARPLWASTSGLACAPATVTLKTSGQASDGGTVFPALGGLHNDYGVWFTTSSAGTISLITADANPVRLNPMAAGTLIAVASKTDDFTVELLGGSPVPSTLTATGTAVSFTMKNGITSGLFTITFTSPSGLATTYSVQVRQVNSLPASPNCS